MYTWSDNGQPVTFFIIEATISFVGLIAVLQLCLHQLEIVNQY